jgi:intracellular septation protein
MWVGFFLVVGGVNLFVAYNFSEEFWVKFKLFGMLGLTLLFIIVQTIWLTAATKRHVSPPNDKDAQ